jgi:AcrR family transcriptional regulator
MIENGRQEEGAMTITTTPGPRHLRAAETRSRIVRAAQSMFVASGYRATSLRDIATAAGVSHPGLLKHFPSKAELLAAVVAQLEADNERAYETIAAASEPGAFVFSELARRNARTPGYLQLYAALTGEASTPSHPAHQRMQGRYARLRALSADHLTEAIQHGVIADDRDPHDEGVRYAAGWDGLQLLAQYLPERIDLVAILEAREELLALPFGWREPDSPAPTAEPSPLPPLGEALMAEPDVGYAPGRLRRGQIVADAMELFATEGYGDTSLRDIAERVGVSKSTLLHHYRSKEQLLSAVLAARDLSIQSGPSYAPADRAAEELRALHIGAADNAEIAPGLIEVYAVLSCEAVPDGHPAHSYFAGRFARVIDHFTELFRLAQVDGDLPAHRDPEQEAIWLVAMWDGLQYQWLYDRAAIDVASHLTAHLDDVLPR